ncbi:MAG: hypothetical protein K2X66_15500, partial [Cyanobacteria bacterium]|nr:hypothetical protein [Cyanobacteriota bacterium]
FSPENAPTSFDSKLMVDIDLSVLGKPWKSYQSYIKAIRQEYQEAPDALYKPRRAQVMKTFLVRSPLYFTPWMQEKYGPQAKRNLKREIAALEKDN